MLHSSMHVSMYLSSDGFKYFLINPFHVNITFLNLLRMSGSLWFSDNFRAYRNGTFVRNELRHTENNEPLKNASQQYVY